MSTESIVFKQDIQNAMSTIFTTDTSSTGGAAAKAPSGDGGVACAARPATTPDAVGGADGAPPSETDALQQQITDEIRSNIATIENFDDMGLKLPLMRGIMAYGFEKPSVIQRTAIPAFIHHDRDMIAQAQSGTGKTATFSISLLQRMDEESNDIQAVILAPTRELATQIHTVIEMLSQYMKFVTVLMSGGQNVHMCKDDIRKKRPAVVVGTPGRVLHFLRASFIDIRHAKYIVLDEADQMLSYDFRDQVRDIFSFLPESARVALYSATISPEMEEVTNSIMKNPVQIRVPAEQLTLEGIRQYKIMLERDAWKFDTLMDIFGSASVYQMVIFCNRKERVTEVKTRLNDEGMPCECIHSQLTQMERSDVMKRFRGGDVRVLATTDLLCRGIDVQQVSLVINYDFPRQRESYLHRIGRSGRFGRKGYAINFVTPFDRDAVQQVCEFYHTEIMEMPPDVAGALS